MSQSKPNPDLAMIHAWGAEQRIEMREVRFSRLTDNHFESLSFTRALFLPALNDWPTILVV
ncbi:MAG: hypothetical protein ACJAZD_000504 [Ilumatobacter sp.]|jgi:hypothetical protein